MLTKALFRKLPLATDNNAPLVSIAINGTTHRVSNDLSVAAALLTLGPAAIRRNPADNSARGPYCMMGVCFECLVEIDDVPNVQSCMVRVAEGMRITTVNATEACHD